jgi:hypothetical protein
MTGILDRIKNTTVADLDKVTGDFSDVAPAVYRPRVEREMVRIVKGADDLKPTVRVANPNAGMVRTDGSGTIDTRPFKGRPTEPQRRFMVSLMDDLKDLDRAAWELGVKYMDDMDAHDAWNPARGENASRWIDRLKAKVAELKARPATSTAVVAYDAFDDIPDGRYAVVDEADGIIKFYRFKTAGPGSQWAGTRFLKVQASDDYHPIRNKANRATILTAIRSMGWQESMIAYGQLIGSCGRCGRTLTDAVSRARGIGPDCIGKM